MIPGTSFVCGATYQVTNSRHRTLSRLSLPDCSPRSPLLRGTFLCGYCGANLLARPAWDPSGLRRVRADSMPMPPPEAGPQTRQANSADRQG